jgi:hypothetical protein
MKWKIFVQIIMLLIITASIFYTVYPKYTFFYKLDDKIKDSTNYYRCNKITGIVEFTPANGSWIKL